MSDEVMELLRKQLIDFALDHRDWNTLQRLTSDGWQRHVVSSCYSSPFDFLCYDEHFLDRRMIDDGRGTTLLNYRYCEDCGTDQIYIGEIRIPLRGTGEFHARFRARHRQRVDSRESNTSSLNGSQLGNDGRIMEPDWFSELVNRARRSLEALRG